MKHSPISPSSAYRWLVCSGSVERSQGLPPQRSSFPTLQGTAAHTLAEKTIAQCIKKDSFISAKGAIGKSIKVVDDAFREVHWFDVDENMIEAVDVYVKFVWEIYEKTDKSCMLLEKRVELIDIDDRLFGTSDTIIVDEKNKELHVLDYKHGKGIPVSPSGNPQLLIYAGGAMRFMDHIYLAGDKEPVEFDIVHTCIVQPRYEGKDSIQQWSIPVFKIKEWEENKLKPGVEALENPTLVAGKHCRFCLGKEGCPEVRKETFKTAQVDFDSYIVPVKESNKLPVPAELNPKQLAKVAELAPVIGDWVDEVVGYIKDELEAGHDIPGLELEPFRTDVRWSKDKKDAAIMYLQENLGDEIFKAPTLKSVKQVEKLLSKKGLDSDTISGYTVSKTHKRIVPINEGTVIEAK